MNETVLINTPLPNHNDSYTVVAYKEIIEKTRQIIKSSGFIIKEEIYRSAENGNIGQGIYHIKPSQSEFANEDELGMMFAWTNSYNKRIRFQCGVGAYVFACSNGMVCGELNYARKHTGNANLDIENQISNQILNAKKVFSSIINDKDALKNVSLSFKNQSELLGRLFFIEDIISPRQLSVVKSEMSNPSYDYGVDAENAWAFYNHVTLALKAEHPKSWMGNMHKFHKFMMANIITSGASTQADTAYKQAELPELDDIDFDSHPEFEL